MNLLEPKRDVVLALFTLYVDNENNCIGRGMMLLLMRERT
jgi:hypothetical protein